MSFPHEDFHEVWWIFSHPNAHGWGGLRIAHFRKTVDGTTVVVINGEIDTRRQGMRIWADITDREGWVKVAQIPIPDKRTVEGAIDARLREIAREIKTAHGFEERRP